MFAQQIKQAALFHSMPPPRPQACPGTAWLPQELVGELCLLQAYITRPTYPSAQMRAVITDAVESERARAGALSNWKAHGKHMHGDPGARAVERVRLLFGKHVRSGHGCCREQVSMLELHVYCLQAGGQQSSQLPCVRAIERARKQFGSHGARSVRVYCSATICRQRSPRLSCVRAPKRARLPFAKHVRGATVTSSERHNESQPTLRQP